MRLFAWEYVTAGGWRECAGAQSLIAEAVAMLGALVRDLAKIPGVEPVIARDPDIAVRDLPAIAVTVDGGGLWESWRRIADAVDVVWPIAPETDGLLERATALMRDAGRPVLASSPDALAVARSKRATARRLAKCGAPVVGCEEIEGPIPESSHGWVVKPNDGAGCTETYFAVDRQSLMGWRERLAGRGFIVQPFVPGPPLSVSMAVQDGAAWLLTCNTQRIQRNGDSFAYCGGTVSGAETRRRDLEPIAAAVAAALPGLWGYIGVDLIDGPEGPVVLEVNPRLTTSYVGLADSIGVNPAKLILALRGTKLRNLRHPLRPRAVEIDIPAAR